MNTKDIKHYEEANDIDNNKDELKQKMMNEMTYIIMTITKMIVKRLR